MDKKLSADKKAFELIWSTWVIIIIAILVLLFLVLFFTASTGSFMDNVKNYFSKTNVDSVVRGCNILVQSDATYEFCCEKKTVKYILDGEKKEAELSCDELSSQEFANNEINKRIECKEVRC